MQYTANPSHTYPHQMPHPAICRYKDGSREAFKSSGRLECMMQDYPQALPSSASVGFTTVNQVRGMENAATRSSCREVHEQT